MTEKQQKCVDRLKRYFDKEDEYNYKTIMSKTKTDKTFENMVQDMTIGVISGKSKLTKNKYQY